MKLLIFFLIFTFIKASIHTFYNDSGAFSCANFTHLNPDPVVAVMAIFGIEQFKICAVDLYAIFTNNKNLINIMTWIHVIGSLFTFVFFNFLYSFIKSYDFPQNNYDTMYRPGAIANIVECAVSFVYVANQLIR
jgi:hypothetical protein